MRLLDLFSGNNLFKRKPVSKKLSFYHTWTIERFSTFEEMPRDTSFKGEPFCTTYKGVSWLWRMSFRPNIVVAGKRYIRLGVQILYGPNNCVELEVFELGVLKFDQSIPYASDTRCGCRLEPGNLYCPTEHGRQLCSWNLERFNSDKVIGMDDQVQFYCSIVIDKKYFKVTHANMRLAPAIQPLGSRLFYSGPGSNNFSTAEQSLCDLRLESADGVQFSCHWLVLVSASPVFAKMYRNEWLETNTNTIRMTDMSGADLYQFLHVVYTGTLSPGYDSVASNVLYASDKYLVSWLKMHLQRLMLTALDRKNAPSYFLLADKHGLDLLKPAAATVVLENLVKTQQSTEWKEICRDDELVDYLLRHKSAKCR